MRVNAIVDADSFGGHHKREQVRIPVGSWAVILDDVQEEPNEFGDYIWQDQSYTYEFIMELGPGGWPQQPEVVLLRKSGFDLNNAYEDQQNANYSFGGSCILNSRVLFWSHAPFAVVRSDGSPYFNHSVFLARQVTEHGLGARLPKFPLPTFVNSKAGVHYTRERNGKWARLTDVAQLCELTPEQVLRVHMNQFGGYMEDGVRFMRSEHSDGVTGAEKCDNAWTHPDQQELVNSSHDDVWVTKHFALCVLYMHMVGFHKDHPELKNDKKSA
ncbi:MAG: hypothetical protein V1695_01620 [Candidatus Uhrbacteria bacterium]